MAKREDGIWFFMVHGRGGGGGGGGEKIGR